MHQHLQNIQAHMNEISGSLSALSVEVQSLEDRAAKAKPAAEEYARVSVAVEQKVAELAAAEVALSKVQKQYDALRKLILG